MTHLWIHGMDICMYVCMYGYMYVGMHKFPSPVVPSIFNKFW